jgi:hypothetical protein
MPKTNRKNEIMHCDKAADFDDLTRAIVTVHDAVLTTGEEQGADRWISHSKYRDQLFRMVISQWCQITELRDHYFPWNTDFICRMWIAYRKRSDASKAEIKEKLFRHHDQLAAVELDPDFKLGE